MLQEAGAATVALPCSQLDKLKIWTLRLLCVVVMLVGEGWSLKAIECDGQQRQRHVRITPLHYTLKK